MMLAYDFEVVAYHFRPPCPLCGRSMWFTTGLEDEEVFRCWSHGWWITDPLEDAAGERLPLVQWVRYPWRFA